MKVVILCGGQGTRLREQTELIPKPMVEIGGRPMLWHIMSIYAHHGLTDFVLCLGYKGHVIKDYFANFDIRSNDLTVRLGGEQKVDVLDRKEQTPWNVTLVDTGDLAQTGARLFRVRDHIGDEPFCVTYGDGLGSVDISKLIDFHSSHGKCVTITGVHPPGRFGELEYDGDRVTAFAEKPQVTESYINGGFFVVQPSFFDRYLNDSEELILEQEPLRQAAADGEMMMFAHDEWWQCMDTFREWKMLQNAWESGSAPWKVWR